MQLRRLRRSALAFLSASASASASASHDVAHTQMLRNPAQHPAVLCVSRLQDSRLESPSAPVDCQIR
ncbi:hypothetical protein M3J07_001037 [Ascochyta lentis]